MRLRPCIFGCWLGLLVLLAGPVHAQRVEAYINADSVTVGERFTLSLVATHDVLAEPSFPVPALDDSLFGDLEVIREVTREQRSLGQGVQVDSVVYEVATFALDTAFVPGIPIRFSADADTFLAASAPVFVPVRSLVPPDAEGIQDLAPLAEFPRPLWPWILIGLAVLVLAGMLWYYLRRRADEPESGAPAPAQPPVPAYEEAMRRLRALERVDLYDEAAVKPFYVELSDLLRTYLERTLHVAALEMTTREVVDRMQSQASRSRVPREAISRVKWVLDLSDLAKFAEVHPEPDQGWQAMGEAQVALQTIEEAGITAVLPSVVLSGNGQSGSEKTLGVATSAKEQPEREEVSSSKEASGKVTFTPSVIITAIITFALITYAGLQNTLIPILGALIGTGIAKGYARRHPPEPHPQQDAFAIQVGHLLWLLVGIVFAYQMIASPVLFVVELILLIVGLSWLLVRPGLGPVLLLMLIHLAGLVGNVASIIEAPVGALMHRALTVHIVLRIGALVLMGIGLYRMRFVKKKTPDLVA